MKRTRFAWTALGAGLVLAASAPVYAQEGNEDVDIEIHGDEGQQGQQGQHPGEQGQSQPGSAQEMATQGTVSGVISKVNFQQGSVTITGKQGATTFRASLSSPAAARSYRAAESA